MEEMTEKEMKTVKMSTTDETRKVTHHESVTFANVLKQNNIINNNSKPTALALIENNEHRLAKQAKAKALKFMSNCNSGICQNRMRLIDGI